MVLKVSPTIEDHLELADISAYLDGELSVSESIAFESHLKDCDVCRAELAEQRQLLCTLNFALDKSSEIELPKNFAQIITARAQSDMQGVRHVSECKRALWLSVALAFLSLLSIDIATGRATLAAISQIYSLITSFILLIWDALMDIGASLAVLIRIIGHHFISEPTSSGLIPAILLIVASILLPLLIINYHRTQAID